MDSSCAAVHIHNVISMFPISCRARETFVLAPTPSPTMVGSSPSPTFAAAQPVHSIQPIVNTPGPTAIAESTPNPVAVTPSATPTTPTISTTPPTIAPTLSTILSPSPAPRLTTVAPSPKASVAGDERKCFCKPKFEYAMNVVLVGRCSSWDPDQ